MGRKKKPTALRVLEGNPSKTPFNLREPISKKSTTCPEWLPNDAKTEWKRVSSTLETLGVLKNLDRASLACYCLAVAKLKDAQKHIEDEGSVFVTDSGYQQQSPYIGIANKAMEQIAKFSSEFGMTPASRSKIIGGENVAGEGTIDEMERLLKRG